MAGNKYIGKGWTRHEAFEDIMKKHPPRKTYRRGDVIVLAVKFSAFGHIYCYLALDDVYGPGDLVKVNVRGETKVVEVVSVGYYSREEYPYTEVKLNNILGPATGNLAEKYREAIREEIETQEDLEAIRKEAKKTLEEAKAIKLDAEEDRRAAEEKRAEAQRQLDEAAKILEEVKQTRDRAKVLTEETKIAGEEARIENARLEAARKEAAKVWKRERPETDNEIIMRLRQVQDALDEDEMIYRGMTDLEEKITKVMERAAELSDEKTWNTVTSEIRRLYDFYLPLTMDVMDQYRNIFSSGLPPASVAKLREEFLDTIQNSIDVYDNILTDLYRDDMMELEAELNALKTMFAVNGLMESDFKIQ